MASVMIMRKIVLLISILALLLSCIGSIAATDTALGNKKFTGDYLEMSEFRTIRALVPYSKTFYFHDKGKTKGASYDFLKAFEKEINKKQKNKVHPANEHLRRK